MLKIEEKENVATVSLNRPDLRNAFNPEMIADLTKTFTEFSKRKDLRAVILKGEGKSFCAGADLTWMKSMVAYSLEENRKDSSELFQMFEAIYNCAVPVIGVVQGHAMGGALGLIAACDVVAAESSTQFCFSETKLGIVPAVISSFVMKKAVHGLVRPMMLSARVFTSAEAHHMGLVHFVGDQNAIEKFAADFTVSLKECGPEAVCETKKLISAVSSMSFADAKNISSQVIAERRVSAEGQEGMRGFLEKKSPSWKKS